MTSHGPPTSRSGRIAALLVIAAAVCFGTTGTAGALGAGDASALSFGAARIVFGGALLAIIALGIAARSRRGTDGTAPAYPAASGDRTGAAPPNTAPTNAAPPNTAPAHTTPTNTVRPHLPARVRLPALGLVAIGAVGVAAYQPAFFTGTRENGVAVGTLVALGSAPILTGLIEWAVRRRPPGRRWALATAVAAAGVAALSGVFGADSGAASVTGLGLAGSLGAGASYAVYALSSKLLLDRGYTPSAAMGATFGTAAVIMLPVLLTSNLNWLGQPGGLIATAWLAVVSVALAYTLFAIGLQTLTASRAATLTLVEPLTATVLGVLLLHEHFSPSIVAGLVLLVAGILILTTGRRLA
ncbi:DMT family transporter [Subtercola boreus]|uniref:DMT family transporter n=1 Tax=Subtercola boreus TaxID=120213 RepID=UPI00155840D9|nr:EamA family transporter [Subtercola boreus]